MTGDHDQDQQRVTAQRVGVREEEDQDLDAAVHQGASHGQAIAAVVAALRGHGLFVESGVVSHAHSLRPVAGTSVRLRYVRFMF